MKMPLGTEVDLCPGHIELDGDPAPLERGTAAPPLFGPCLLWPRSPISATAELVFYSNWYICVVLLYVIAACVMSNKRYSNPLAY